MYHRQRPVGLNVKYQLHLYLKVKLPGCFRSDLYNHLYTYRTIHSRIYR